MSDPDPTKPTVVLEPAPISCPNYDNIHVYPPNEPIGFAAGHVRVVLDGGEPGFEKLTVPAHQARDFRFLPGVYACTVVGLGITDTQFRRDMRAGRACRIYPIFPVDTKLKP
jgi:hypothetical protein